MIDLPADKTKTETNVAWRRKIFGLLNSDTPRSHEVAVCKRYHISGVLNDSELYLPISYLPNDIRTGRIVKITPLERIYFQT